MTKEYSSRDGLSPEYSIWSVDASNRLNECLAQLWSDDDGSDGAEGVREMAKAWALIEGHVVILQDGEYVADVFEEVEDWSGADRPLHLVDDYGNYPDAGVD